MWTALRPGSHVLMLQPLLYALDAGASPCNARMRSFASDLRSM
jgi:hypothetical protein